MSRHLLGVLLLFFALSGSARAATRYASPDGSGTACTETARCSLTTAVGGAGDFDQLVVGPGTYGSQASPVDQLFFDTSSRAELRGEFVGIRRPVIFGSIRSRSSDGAFSDLTIIDTRDLGTAMTTEGASVDRVIARATGASGDGCNVTDGEITNVVCVGSDGGILGTHLDARHATGLAAAGTGISESPGDSVTASIARGGAQDVFVFGTSALTDVAFNSLSGTPTSNTGQLTAEPVFRDEVAGDFRQAASSPTIDAAVNTTGSSQLDLNGNLRTLGAKTDMGAYEHVPTPPSFGAITTNDITATSARIQVGVTTNGGATETSVFVGTTTGNKADPGGHAFTVGTTTPVSQSVTLTGLAPGTTYHYSVQSQSDGGLAFTSDATFTTALAAPTATSAAATSLTTTSATLNGAVDLGGATSASAAFELDGADVGAQLPSASGPVSSPVTGLAPNSTHSYRLRVTTSAGTGVSLLVSFTTPPLAPTATTGDATNVTSTAATLAGTVDTRGVQGTVSMLVDGTPVGEATRGSGTFSVDATGLAPGVAHAYRTRVTTTGGTTLGTERTFSTLPQTTAGDTTTTSTTPTTITSPPATAASAPSATATPTPSSGAPRPVRDPVPALSAKVTKKGLRIATTCGNQACRFTATSRLTAGRRTLRTLARLHVDVAANRSATRTIRISAKLRKKLKAARNPQIELALRWDYATAPDVSRTQSIRVG